MMGRRSAQAERGSIVYPIILLTAFLGPTADNSGSSVGQTVPLVVDFATLPKGEGFLLYLDLLVDDGSKVGAKVSVAFLCSGQAPEQVRNRVADYLRGAGWGVQAQGKTALVIGSLGTYDRQRVR